LQKLKELSVQEWKLLLVALIMLPVVALLLRLAGYNRTRNSLSKFIPKEPGYNNSQEAGSDQAKTIARMVSIAACYGPYRANCLKQSLVLWWLLARCGLASEIRFGVKKEPEEEFGAHAWVEFNGMNLCDSEVLQKQVAQFKKVHH
jgi:hypothetical protein